MNKMSYEEWLKQVDARLIRKCGMGYEDLPDYCYMDAYEAGDTPAQTARDAFRAACCECE